MSDPIIVIVYNNNAWGTGSGNSRSPVTLSRHLFQENIRYDKVAGGLGARSEYATQPGEFKAALKPCYQIADKESRPSLTNCQAKKEFWVKQQDEPVFLSRVELGCMFICSAAPRPRAARITDPGFPPEKLSPVPETTAASVLSAARRRRR
ncbi:MAG TPA: thiamine pyrophosphate-dependent enzyme [Blastocatellia bacterium]